MLHIYILTLISEASKAVSTVNTWPGLASCHFRNKGRVSGRCACILRGLVYTRPTDGRPASQLHLLCVHQLLRAFMSNLTAMGKKNMYVIHLAYAKMHCQAVR